MQKITVVYNFERTIVPTETEQGILLNNGQVFVAGHEIGLYPAYPTDEAGVYLVDLDKDCNLIEDDPARIIDLLAADPGGGGIGLN